MKKILFCLSFIISISAISQDQTQNLIFDNNKFIYFRNALGDSDGVRIGRHSGNSLRIRYMGNFLVFDALDNYPVIFKNSSDATKVQIHTGGDSFFNGGNIGIGTTQPNGKLDVVGLSYLRAAPTHSTVSEQIRIGRSDLDIRYHSIFSNHTGTPNDNYLEFRVHNGTGAQNTDQVSVMTLTGEGRVGIGTTTPSERLNVFSETSGVLSRFASSANGGSSGIRIQGNSIDGSDKRFLDLFFDPETYSYGLGAGTNSGTLPIGGGLSQADILVNASGNVGIGTSDPKTKLDIEGNIYLHGGMIQINRSYENYGNVVTLHTRDDNHFGDFRFEASKTNDNVVKQLLFIDGDKGALGIGTEDIPQEYLFAVNGKAIMEEVKVEMSESWPDYVFESDYTLRTLKETEDFIKENKHLPEVPSAKEVEENGIYLGEMNALLLKKIEELTLYQIEMMKRLDDQQKEIEKLKSDN